MNFAKYMSPRVILWNKLPM